MTHFRNDKYLEQTPKPRCQVNPQLANTAAIGDHFSCPLSMGGCVNMTHFRNDKYLEQPPMPRCQVTSDCQIELAPLPCQATSPPAQCTMHYVFLKTTSAIPKWLKFLVEYEILQNSQCGLLTFCLHICPPASLTCLPSLSAQSTPQHHVGKKLPAMQIVKIMHLEVYIHT